MKEPEYAGRDEAFPSSAGRALARLGYLLIALAVVAIPLGLIAAASGEAALAWIAAACALVLLIVGGGLWRWQASRKQDSHPESSDRQVSAEGKGPLDI
ncbi:hypothetical protein [Hoyosella altamirensis]|uniref:Type IV secretory pathway TrbD component n=1 Tax=Hoyosella altamirensis TaxID=616997 RepID=A0A839RRR5_9ACTN|nr:hypothetical protein [Hoyosella altamirensis]MBB3038794.1 type IV secretory pathway TrbD component [Hoyosella altamirensis]